MNFQLTSNSVALDTNPFSVPLSAMSINAPSAPLLANAPPMLTHRASSTPPAGVSPQHIVQINQIKQQQMQQVADLSKNVSKRNNAQNGSGVSGATVGAFGELDSMAKNWLQSTNQNSASAKNPSQDSGIKISR